MLDEDMKETNRSFSVFNCWQSDVKEARNAITNALKKAKKSLKKTPDIEIELDESTRNVPGMPKIEDTIKKKIENCDVFVADITPVGKCDNKLLPNPNVLLELGYAQKTLGLERIILIAQNKEEWDLKDLPFDLNHHRIKVFESKEDLDLSRDIKTIIDYIVSSRGVNGSPEDKMSDDISVNNHDSDDTKALEDRLERPVLHQEPLVFFSMRVGFAFPGDRGVKWYTEVSDIKLHLSALFQEPLIFSRSETGGMTDPIWWFARGQSMPIEDFKHITDRLFLAGNEEWMISRIAVYQNHTQYYREYVYIEVEAQEPVFPQDAVSEKAPYGATEEYGLLHTAQQGTFEITRQEYDDGGCKRNGELLRGDTVLRERYLTKYNFIVCSKHSPFNSSEFDRGSRFYLDGILDGTVSFEDFHAFMMSFPKPY